MKSKDANGDNPAVRLDKWLWAAHFYKIHALAREMIEGGKVRYNGQRSKPGNNDGAGRRDHLAPRQQRASGEGARY